MSIHSSFLEELLEVGFLKDQNLSHLFYIPCQFSVEMLSSQTQMCWLRVQHLKKFNSLC